MGLKNLRYKVKEQQEKVNEKLDTFAKFQEEWVENADRWVTGFLENFEEGFHSMGTKIREKITGSMGQSGNLVLIQYDDFVVIIIFFALRFLQFWPRKKGVRQNDCGKRW